jgi:hypothetical protein
MQSIKYTVEKYPGFETVEDKRYTSESDPKEFVNLLRLFSDRHPHLLDGEQVKVKCLSCIPNSDKPARLSRDCFSVEVSKNGDVSVFCAYSTTHPDGDRLHTYLLTSYAND